MAKKSFAELFKEAEEHPEYWKESIRILEEEQTYIKDEVDRLINLTHRIICILEQAQSTQPQTNRSIEVTNILTILTNLKNQLHEKGILNDEDEEWYTEWLFRATRAIPVSKPIDLGGKE